MDRKEQIENEKSEARRQTKRFDTTVELVDIDHAILTYIKEKIADKFLVPNDRRNIDVSVFMKNPERWIDKKDLSSVKDITGNHYKFPIIGIARNGIDIVKNRVPHWIKDEDLSYIINKGYKASNKENGDPYYRMVRRPAYIDANYEFEIISDSQPHVNYITEQFVYHEGKYWTDNENYSFRTSFNSVMDGSIPASGEQERLIISSISAVCRGYILPEYAEGEDINVKFISSISKVELDEKIVTSESITNKQQDKNLWN